MNKGDVVNGEQSEWGDAVTLVIQRSCTGLAIHRWSIGEYIVHLINAARIITLLR